MKKGKRNIYKLIIPLLFAGCFLMFSCTESGVGDEPEVPTETETPGAETDAPGTTQDNPLVKIEMAAAERDVVTADNAFALEVFKKIVAADEEPNINMSALSLSTALSLVAGGARGETQTQMLEVLGFKDLDAANRLNARLAAELPTVDNVTTFAIANSIWLDNSTTPDEDFLSDCRKNYSAEIFKVTLASVDAMNEINGWTEKKTNGIIANLLEAPFMDGTKFSVVNAMYFKGAWKKPFDKNFTTEERFENIDGTSSNVPMMREGVSGNGVYDTDGAHWINLPYGNGAYEMMLILPDEGKTIDEYLSALTPSGMNELLDARRAFAGIVKLPRFKFSSKYELSEILALAGMGKAFSDDADFSPLCPGLRINAVIQKTVIEVDEGGSEAAAATVVGGFSSPGDMVTGNFIFDRPFAFMIMEQSSRAILFMGRVGKL